MSRRLFAVAVSFASLLATPAAARSITEPTGGFTLQLPDDYRVVRSGPAQAGLAHVLYAQSGRGNIKVFARSVPFAGGQYDFVGHFARWEGKLLGRRFYSRLRPVTPLRRSALRDVPLFYRIYDGVGTRRRSQQPYRLFTLATHSPAARKVYTLTVAANRRDFASHHARVRQIISSFKPLGLSPAPRAPSRFLPGVRRVARWRRRALRRAPRRSLRGRLRRKVRRAGILGGKRTGRPAAISPPGSRPRVRRQARVRGRPQVRVPPRRAGTRGRSWVRPRGPLPRRVGRQGRYGRQPRPGRRPSRGVSPRLRPSRTRVPPRLRSPRRGKGTRRPVNRRRVRPRQGAAPRRPTRAGSSER